MPGQSWEEAFADFSKADALRRQMAQRIGLAVGCTLGLATISVIATRHIWGDNAPALKRAVDCVVS